MDWAPVVRQRTELAKRLATNVANLLAKRDLSENQAMSLLTVIEAFCDTVDNMTLQMALEEGTEDHLTSMVADLDNICMSLAEDVSNRLAELRLRRLSADRDLTSR